MIFDQRPEGNTEPFQCLGEQGSRQTEKQEQKHFTVWEVQRDWPECQARLVSFIVSSLVLRENIEIRRKGPDAHLPLPDLGLSQAGFRPRTFALAAPLASGDV